MNTNKKPKRIGLDARLYGPDSTGIGRYEKEVFDRILELDQENDYVVFLSPKNFSIFHTANPRVKKVLVKARSYTLAEQIIFPFILMREKLDLVHFPHFTVPILYFGNFVVTIHDLILFYFPTRRASTLGPILYFIKNLAYKFVISSAVHRAQKIIAVSDFTKQDIIKNFNIKSDKINTTLEGVSDFVSEKSEDEKILAELPEKFILYVGHSYPHKNLEILLKAFLLVRQERPDLHLIFCGKEDYFYARLKKEAAAIGAYKAGDNNSPVIFAGFAPDDLLDALYRRASAFVYPSLYEGFGLPPLEAMQRGCPVLSSNAGPMPEVLGEAALFFDPRNLDDIKKKITLILEDENLRVRLINKGHEQVKKYSWNDCAERTLDIYNNI